MRSSFHSGVRRGLFHILLAVIVCGAAGLARAAELPARANESDEDAAKRRAGAKDAKKKPEAGAYLASVRLRGGIDGNPTLSPEGAPQAFIGLDAAVAVGREDGGVLYGLTGEASTTRYVGGQVAPTERVGVTLSLANQPAQGEIGWRSTTATSRLSTYDTRAVDLVQSLRLERRAAALRAFVTAELRLSELNETNALFPTFLPVPHRFARATVIPGAALTLGDVELGVSANLSATRYLDELDLFGFRRRNERVQPFAFLRYRSGGFGLFANVSRLYGFWHDPDFSPVERTLFDVSATYLRGSVSLELGLQRAAAETTFPLSPITVQTVASAKVHAKVSERIALAAAVRHGTVEYLDTPLSSRLTMFGLEATYEPRPGFVLGAELVSRHFDSVAGLPARGVSFSLSAMRRLGGEERSGAASRVAPPPAFAGHRRLAGDPFRQ